ncbi:MAG: hypothetical protein FJ088_06690, partial [Deltaproteobacteria bacterium]|nr:hypothetical protein [Deltaproteobacteria bacterium]
MKRYLLNLFFLPVFFLFSCSGGEKTDKEVIENDVAVKEVIENDVAVNEEDSTNNQPSFSTPQGIIAAGGMIVVTNPAFDMTNFTFGDGFITIIDKTKLDVVNLIKTSKKNPQYLAADGKNLYVVCTGGTAWDMDTSTVKPVSEGSIEVFALATLKTATAPDKILAVPPGTGNKLFGAPGKMVISTDEKTAFVGSTTAGILFKVDLAEMKVVNNSDNPITIVE